MLVGNNVGNETMVLTGGNAVIKWKDEPGTKDPNSRTMHRLPVDIKYLLALCIV